MATIDKDNLLKNLYHSVGVLRGIHFTAQSALLPIINKIASSERKNSFAEFKQQVELALPKMNTVLKKDAESIVAGYYPKEVLFQDSLIRHAFRIPVLFADAYRAARQRANKESEVFEAKDFEFLTDVPEYYKRNFHFQKGGYLNDESAKLYDHQVEVLFSGTAHAMRRQIIPKLKHHFNMSDGEGLKFLELGSGAGSLTRNIALAFPKAQITCVDMSPHYLNFAKKNLSTFKRISYVQGMAENLNFKSESFDAVFSCYMFHELPEKVRLQVIDEKIRVLKSNGFLGIVDSLQLDDDSDLNWALEQFPTEYHEPFYKNYIQKNVHGILETYNLNQVSSDYNFLTKVVSAIKP